MIKKTHTPKSDTPTFSSISYMVSLFYIELFGLPDAHFSFAVRKDNILILLQE